MKNKDKIILLTLLALIAFSLSLGFKKYVIDKDYYVFMHTPCVTEDSTCFSFEDEETGESELYLKVYRKAYKVEQCMNEGCDPYACNVDEVGCLTITCSEEDLDEGEVCNSNKE